MECGLSEKSLPNVGFSLQSSLCQLQISRKQLVLSALTLTLLQSHMDEQTISTALSSLKKGFPSVSCFCGYVQPAVSAIVSASIFH